MTNNLCVVYQGTYEYFQLVTRLNAEVDFLSILYAVVPALIGSTVRILYERQTVKVSLSRKFYIVVCSISLAYVAHVVSLELENSKLVGVFSLGAGIISVDVVNWMIKELPLMFSDIFKYFAMKNSFKSNTKKDDDDGL